jgi:ATP dependent DNA ligase domain
MRSLNSLPTREAGFVEPMECLAVTKLPDGPDWVYEIKFDGYRALAINANGKLSLYSRRRKSFNRQYQHVFEALRDLPQNTVVDGEIVALDDAGRPRSSPRPDYGRIAPSAGAISSSTRFSSCCTGRTIIWRRFTPCFWRPERYKSRTGSMA